MNNQEKALVLIDANGHYDKEKREHHTMESAMVDEKFYNILVSEIESGKYSEILYNINLPYCTTREEIEDALKKDPVLSKISKEYKKKVKVFMVGNELSKEFYTGLEAIKLENELAEKGYEFVLAGLYYDWCVETHERNLRGRYPNIKIYRPENLSKRSSSRGRRKEQCEILQTRHVGRRTVPRVPAEDRRIELNKLLYTTEFNQKEKTND